MVKTKIGALDSVYQTLREQYNAASLGNAKPEPRWMQCVAQVQMNLGTALSNVYVKNRLTTADKEVVNETAFVVPLINFNFIDCPLRSTTLFLKSRKSSIRRSNLQSGWTLKRREMQLIN